MLKYRLEQSNSCSSQKTNFLMKYYNKQINNMMSSNLSKNDTINKYKSLDNVNVIYGEPCAYELDTLISRLDINENDVFYDLGSGNGNVCATFLFSTPIKKSIGIELSSDRHNEAIRIKSEIQKNYSNQLENKQLEYIHDNFMNYDYANATIVFMDSVLFTDKTLHEIENILIKAPNIKYLISMKAKYNPIHFKLKETLNIKATWGKSVIYIYTK